MATNQQTSAMVEGALMAVIGAIIGLAGLYLPFFGLVTSLLVPLPTIILIRKHSLKVGVLSLIVTTLLVMLLSGQPLAGLSMAIQFSGIAIVYGIALKNNFGAGKTVAIGGLTFLLSSILGLFLSFYLTGFNLLDLDVTIKESIDQSIQIMRDSGQMAELEKVGVTEIEFKDKVQEVFAAAKRLIPAMLLFYATFIAYINYVVSLKILKRLNFAVPTMLPFKEWRLPWYSIWVIISGIGITMMGDYFNLVSIISLGQNIVLGGVFLFFFIGLSFTVYYYQKAKMTRFFKVMLLAFLVINLFAGFWVITFLGLADTIFNLRKVLNKNNNEITK